MLMTTVLVLIPVALIAAFAMYLQYRTLSETRRKHPLWRAFCVLPVAMVGILLLWAAWHS